MKGQRLASFELLLFSNRLVRKKECGGTGASGFAPDGTCSRPALHSLLGGTNENQP
jgi:hypothetical protein